MSDFVMSSLHLYSNNTWSLTNQRVRSNPIWFDRSIIVTDISLFPHIFLTLKARKNTAQLVKYQLVCIICQTNRLWMNEWTLFKHGIKSLKLITKCSPFEPCCIHSCPVTPTSTWHHYLWSRKRARYLYKKCIVLSVG